MRNKMMDLHNHLFAQLERLSDEDVKGEELKSELERADAVAKIAQNIIKNADVCLKAERMKYDGMILKTPEMLENKGA